LVVHPTYLLLTLALFWFAYVLGRSRSSREVSRLLDRLRSEKRELEASADRDRRMASELRDRLAEAHQGSAQLENSLLELPEIAQRLAASRSLREIPGAALDLICEIFVPGYCVFYTMNQSGLVAVATRGNSPHPLGHRPKLRGGVIGWAALRQMPVSCHDVGGLALDEAHDDAPDFTLALPVVNGNSTLGVILIGPTERDLPRGREVGGTIALITAVTIASANLLREQAILAKTDGLTGLMNRTHLLKTVEQMVAKQSVPQMSLFLFDVDHFKHYNDTYGHLAGADLLRGLAALLKESVREGELVGRYGGEEFLMVLPGVVGEDARLAAERVREVIAEHVFKHEEKQPLGDVTVSGGVATWPLHGHEAAEVLQHADEALYAAKEAGRNRVHLYQQEAKPDADPIY
jgi:diguanylate cyclase (GGDEF)-like protein